MQFYIMQLVAMKAASRSLEFSNAAKASRMLAALHLAFINWAQFVAVMLWPRSIPCPCTSQICFGNGAPCRGTLSEVTFSSLCTILTPFLSGERSCVICDLKQALKVFLISNTSDNFNNVQALHSVLTVARQPQR